MTKFSNKFKKPCFWSILGPFSQFLGQKKVSWKIRLCHAQLHMGFQQHARIQKKLVIQLKRKHPDGRAEGQAKGQTDPILQNPSGYHQGSNEAKEQKRKFIGMLLGTLAASLLGNMLASKRVVRGGEGVI